MCCAYGIIRLLGVMSLFCCCQTSFFFPSNLFLRRGFSLVQLPSIPTVSALQISPHQPQHWKKKKKFQFSLITEVSLCSPIPSLFSSHCFALSDCLTYLAYKQKLCDILQFLLLSGTYVPEDSSTQI